MSTAFDDPQYLTASEAAKLLRVHVETIYRHVERGSLPAFRLTESGSLRIPVGALMVGGEARAHDRTRGAPRAVEPVAAAREEAP